MSTPVIVKYPLTLSQTQAQRPNAPRLCWFNYVNALNTTLETGVTSSFFENLANPATTLYAQIDTTDEFYIDVEIPTGAPVDYVGIARHNLQPGAQIKIEFIVNGSAFLIRDWTEVGANQAILKLFNEGRPETVRVSFRGQGDFVRIAVLYVGLSIVFPRNIYVGHTPITMGRSAQRIGGITEGGQYPGEIVRRRWIGTAVSLQNLKPIWYRETLDPFIGQTDRAPAFWAWRPDTYPNEVAYAWLTGDPRPSNQRPNGMMQVDFNLEGIA